MKKRFYIVGIISVLVMLSMACYLLYMALIEDVSNPYRKLKSINVEQLLKKEEEYYVYAQRKGCPYCDNVKNEILDFAKKNTVFVLDTRDKENDNIKDYDWIEHHKLYDVEVGRVVDGEMIFEKGLTQNKLKQRYSPLDYSIKKADEEYVKLNEGKEVEKIYAVRESPVIDYSKVTKENMVIPAVPMLFHVKDKKIENYYFGDAQILKFLGSDKKPIDDYIN